MNAIMWHKGDGVFNLLRRKDELTRHLIISLHWARRVNLVKIFNNYARAQTVNIVHRTTVHCM